MTQPNDIDTPAQKLARLRDEDRTRRDALAAKAVDQEIERLELISRFERELGPRFERWDLLDANDVGAGLFVVALGPAVVFKTYQRTEQAFEDQVEFVASCLKFPSADAFSKAWQDHAGIVPGLSLVLSRLYGVKLSGLEKKAGS